MRRLLPLLTAGLILGCSRAEPGPQDGQAYFKQLNCRSCHRVGGEGAGRGGPDLSTVGFRRSKEWLDLYLKDPKAWDPNTLMPNPRLSEKGRAALVNYLSGLRGEAWVGERPWTALTDPVAKGRLIYNAVGCVSCHGSAGKGGYPNNNVEGGKIPALNNVRETFTKDELKKKIAKGVVPVAKDPAAPAPMLQMPAWGVLLDAAELDALVEYLMTLTPGKGAEPAGF